MIMLQVWAWEHFLHIAPVRWRTTTMTEDRPLLCHWGADFDVTDRVTHVIREYREAFDLQVPEQVHFTLLHFRLTYTQYSYVVINILNLCLIYRLSGSPTQQMIWQRCPTIAWRIATFSWLAFP